MAHLKLHLLGAARIERDRAPVEVDTRKAIALIAYLALTRQPHSRDALATLLWPDYDQTHARATLRRTLSALNKALDGDWIESGRETLALRRENLWVDVDAFLEHVAAAAALGAADDGSAAIGPLGEAAALYRGDFMAGFSLRDAPAFDEWQFFQAEGLRRDLAAALERLTRCHAAAGAYEQAIPHARRWLALDPLHEPAHREVMRLFAAAGQRGAALHQYRECVRVLDRELGVPPLEETTELYRIIKENRLDDPRLQIARDPAPAAPQPAHHPTAAGAHAAPAQLHTAPSHLTSPLVGRDSERAALLGAYAEIDADGRLLVIEGEGGIGKTRLAEDVLEQIRARGAVTMSVRCYEGETDLAYGPLAAGMGAVTVHPGRADWYVDMPPLWLSEASRLFPDLLERYPNLAPPAPLGGADGRNRFFEGVSQVLLAACRGPAPGVLFVDDAHWADAASLDLLSYLVRRLRGRPICVLLTWRSEHVGTGHRLRQLVGEAQRAGMGLDVRLGRLSRDDVAALVGASAAAGVPLPPAAAELLYRETEGLPLFLSEYLAAVASAGASIGELPPLPGSIRDVLLARLGPVSETGRQALATAAVIGRSFDFDTLHAASGRTEDEVVAALEDLIALGLVTEAHDPVAGAPTYDFNHEKLRALVYEETSLARRRLLHRRVAEALAALPHGRRDSRALAGQIAHHYQLGGQDLLAAEAFRAAGDYARSLYANAEALTHYRAALALGHQDAAALHESIGDLHTLRGEYTAAITSYETAAALCDPSQLARLEYKLGRASHRRGAWDLAESHFQAALAALGDESCATDQALIYAEWSLSARQAAGPESIARAAGLAVRALELAEGAGDAHALARAHTILGALAAARGDERGALRHLEHSLTLAEALGDDGERVAALHTLALASAAAGDHERAQALAEDALTRSAAHGDRHREAALRSALADLLHAAGRPEAAMPHLEQAVAIYAEIGVEAGALRPEIWKLTEW